MSRLPFGYYFVTPNYSLVVHAKGSTLLETRVRLGYLMLNIGTHYISDTGDGGAGQHLILPKKQVSRQT